MTHESCQSEWVRLQHRRLICPFFRLRPPARDERDREIDRKSMMAAVSLFWILLVIGSVGMGVALGWDTVVQVPAWAFSEPIWYGMIVILAVKSAVSIRMYHAG